MRYRHKRTGTIYNAINMNLTEMKDPTTGKWLPAVMYVTDTDKDTSDMPIYIRERKDFLEKFELT